VSAAQGSSTTVSRSDIRFIQHLPKRVTLPCASVKPNLRLPSSSARSSVSPHLEEGFQQGPYNSARVFNTVPTIQQGFQYGPSNSTGISKGSLKFNRDLKRDLKVHRRGLTTPRAWAHAAAARATPPGRGISTGNLEFNSGFNTVLTIQQRFQYGPYDSPGVSKGSLNATGGASPRAGGPRARRRRRPRRRRRRLWWNPKVGW
jgi:hypothetical protein